VIAGASLRSQVTNALRSGIVSGEIESGHVYSARAFADRLGVSPTPVREALLDLANDGLVVPVRNRGFLVPRPTDRDLDEIFELRMLLEVPALAGLAGSIRPEDLAAPRAIAERIVESAIAGDIASFLEQDRAFHLALLAFAGNARLMEIVRRLRDEVRLVGLPELAAAGTLVDSAREHELILEAARCGDSDSLESLMRTHLRHTRGIWAGRHEGA
jgi:DNA-binding GntR family transcriptional regulator